MRWAERRKLTYLSILLLPILIVIGIIVYSLINQPETCSDGVKNQNELGIDCGGICQKICQARQANLQVVWSRSFPVAEDIYNAAAYIKNPNVNLQSDPISYEFRLYDKNNLLIAEKRGEIAVPSQPHLVVFAGRIDTQGRVPARTVFEFTEPPYWTKNKNNVTLSVVRHNLNNTASEPILKATIKNSTTKSVNSITVVALIKNTVGNVINVSRTYIPQIKPRSTEDITFTWPEPFDKFRRICPSGGMNCNPNSFLVNLIITGYKLK